MTGPWRLTYPARPWTVNKERTLHHHALGRLVTEWRTTFKLLALEAKVPTCQRISIDVHVETKTARSMPDPGACYGAVKAAVDGLVDARVIPNDRGAEVAWIRLFPAEVTGRDALTLAVAEEA